VPLEKVIGTVYLSFNDPPSITPSQFD